MEELTDKVEENTVDTQTDPMMDRPPTPLFVPFKTGRDMETQIEDGDLFDFNFEVEPILEVCEPGVPSLCLWKRNETGKAMTKDGGRLFNYMIGTNTTIAENHRNLRKG